MTTDGEAELVRRAAGEDLAAFALLVRMHEAGLRRYLRRLAGDDADDLAQQTFLVAWRALGQWRGEGRFASWLMRIATRRYLDRQRKLRPQLHDAVDFAQASVGPNPDLRLVIDQALASLAPRERAAALLVFAEGQSHVEAAQSLGVPLGTLKSLVARARGKLVPLLEGES